MKLLVINILILISFNSHASSAIEQLNFFPKTKQFIRVDVEHVKTFIEGPGRALGTQKLRNYSNALAFSYAHKFRDSIFFGIKVPYQSVTESETSDIGTTTPKKFSSQGFSEPEVFTLIQLRQESSLNGLIHLWINYANKIDNARIGKNESNGLKGRNILRLKLLHGQKQSEWEFQTFIKFDYYGEGVERDAFTNKEFENHSYNEISLGFKAQYEFNSKVYLQGGIGFQYRGDQDSSYGNGYSRKIQAGTGSQFEFRTKYRINENNIVEVAGLVESNDYFVSDKSSNFDATISKYTGSMSYIKTF